MNNTKPILFPTPMVQAILRGQKLQTRRICKPLKGTSVQGCYHRPDGLFIGTHLPVGVGVGVTNPFKCPFGEIGTVLWCRETWQWEGNTKYTDASPIGGFYYLADADQYGPHKWRSSLHMPSEACRLFLRIADISVERLNDISEEDAIAEGIENILPNMPEDEAVWRDYNPTRDFVRHYDDPRQSFKSLWESINGKGSWEVNPWVWKISFVKIDKPDNW